MVVRKSPLLFTIAEHSSESRVVGRFDTADPVPTTRLVAHNTLAYLDTGKPRS